MRCFVRWVVLDKMGVGRDGHWTRWSLDEMGIGPNGHWTKWVLDELWALDDEMGI